MNLLFVVYRLDGTTFHCHHHQLTWDGEMAIATPLTLSQALALPLAVQPAKQVQPTRSACEEVDKVILRAVSGNAKKDSRFTLRHIKPSGVCTCVDLKRVIKSQLVLTR